MVEAEVEVYDAGDYHLTASLYTKVGTPVGAMESNHALVRGVHWLPMRFHGKLMHDSKRAGPYRLAHVQLEKVSFPTLEGVYADPDYWTHAHRVEAFDAMPYNDLDLDDDEAT